jgi:hypothetical protein
MSSNGVPRVFHAGWGVGFNVRIGVCQSFG